MIAEMKNKYRYSEMSGEDYSGVLLGFTCQFSYSSPKSGVMFLWREDYLKNNRKYFLDDPLLTINFKAEHNP